MTTPNLLPLLVFVAVGCVPAAEALAQVAPEPPAPAHETPVWPADAGDVVRGALAEVGAFLAPREDGGASLSVEAAVAQALAENGQALAARAEVEAQAAQRGQANAARLPQLTAQSAYTYIDGLPVELYEGNALTFLAGAEVEAERGQLTSTITLEQVLYAGGRIAAAVRASDYLAQAQVWRREVTLDELEFQTKQAYYDLLLAEALVEVAASRVEVVARQLRDARNMFEAGMTSRLELLRAETELSQRRADAENARTGVTLARLNLARLLAAPQDARITVRGGGLRWAPPQATLQVLVAQAAVRRPELRALDSGLAAAREQIRAARGGYKPNAAASLSYTDIEGGTSILPEGWQVGVGVEWELYTGGRRKHEVLQAEAEARRIAHERDSVADLVELDVRRAHAQLGDALARIRAEQGTVGVAQEALRLAQLRFVEGAGTQTETLNAVVALAAAKTNLLRALRDFAVASASLEKALSVSWTPRDVPDDAPPAAPVE